MPTLSLLARDRAHCFHPGELAFAIIRAPVRAPPPLTPMTENLPSMLKRNGAKSGVVLPTRHISPRGLCPVCKPLEASVEPTASVRIPPPSRSHDPASITKTAIACCLSLGRRRCRTTSAWFSISTFHHVRRMTGRTPAVARGTAMQKLNSAEAQEGSGVAAYRQTLPNFGKDKHLAETQVFG